MPDKESGRKFASGMRPEKLISCPLVHTLLLTAVTSSDDISCGGTEVKFKEKQQRKKSLLLFVSGTTGTRCCLLRDATQKHLPAAGG